MDLPFIRPLPLPTPPAKEGPTTGDFDFPRSSSAYRRYATVVGIGIFVTTPAQTAVLGDLPLRFLLKDRLHVRPQTMAVFMQLAVLPWQVKIVAGLLSDSLPCWGCGESRTSCSAGSGRRCFGRFGIVFHLKMR